MSEQAGIRGEPVHLDHEVHQRKIGIKLLCLVIEGLVADTKFLEPDNPDEK